MKNSIPQKNSSYQQKTSIVMQKKIFTNFIRYNETFSSFVTKVFFNYQSLNFLGPQSESSVPCHYEKCENFPL